MVLLKARGVSKEDQERSAKEAQRREAWIDWLILNGCSCEYGGTRSSWDPYCKLHRTDGGAVDGEWGLMPMNWQPPKTRKKRAKR